MSDTDIEDVGEPVNTIKKVTEIGLPGGLSMMKVYTITIVSYSPGGLELDIPELHTKDYVAVLSHLGGAGPTITSIADGSTVTLIDDHIRIYGANGTELQAFGPGTNLEFNLSLVLIRKTMEV